MKVFSLILSIITFIITLYFLIADFPKINEVNDVIYICLLIILLVICFTGILINKPIFNRERRKMKIYITRRYSASKKATAL